MPFGPLRLLHRTRLSLKIKLPALSALILILVFGAAASLLIRTNVESEKQSLLSKARNFSKLATKPLGDAYNFYFNSGYFKFREILIDTTASNPDITRIQIISVKGQVLFDTVDLDSPSSQTSSKIISDKKTLKAVESNKSIEVKGTSGDISEIIVPYIDDFGARPFSIRYFISYESIYETINDTIISIFLLALAALVVTFLSMTYLVHREVLSPLDKIVKSARDISRGNLGKMIKLDGKDELADLAGSLNQMTNRLKKNIEDLKQLDSLKNEFIFLASHNLRTPITIIKGYISTLLGSSTITGQDKENLIKVDESTRSLEATTESLLNLVSLEKDTKLTKKEINLAKIIKSILDSLSTKAAEKKINFVLEFSDQSLPKIEVDEKRIHQALFSLIENAIKFNEEKGKIKIKVKKKGKKLLTAIEDTGIGIPKQEQSLVFQKFHRATDILTYDYEGIGLGLYLTKLIIEAHDGRIWFESEEGKGTTFYVELPLKGE